MSNLLKSFQSKTATTTTASTKSTGGGSAIVECVRAGKASQVIEVPAGTSVKDVVANIGWSGNNTYRLNKAGEAHRDATEISKIETGGNWQLMVTPRVAGAAG